MLGTPRCSDGEHPVCSTVLPCHLLWQRDDDTPLQLPEGEQLWNPPCRQCRSYFILRVQSWGERRGRVGDLRQGVTNRVQMEVAPPRARAALSMCIQRDKEGFLEEVIIGMAGLPTGST